MSDREALRLDFLRSAGLAEAVRAPLPGDASTRRYERLTTASGATLMLMDQAPAAESQPCDPSWTPEQRHAHGWNAVARLSAGRIEAFAAVAAHLKSLGLSAPDIIAVDAPNGLAVIEDFGDALFTSVIAAGDPEERMYAAAIQSLVILHEAPTPEVLHGLAGDWPLLTYDQTALQGGADLFVEWLPKLIPSLSFDEAAVAEWRAVWAPITAMGEAGATVMAHRDFHAENLIWLPQRSGFARAGMIDFQDAVRAHPCWDLHSLLQDARRDLGRGTEGWALDRYFYQRPSVDREAFMAAYAGLAALNEARILGVFARLIARDAKPKYAAFMPRMWAHLNANLKAPGLEAVAAWMDRHVPEDLRR
ncbi:N-acetylmuramate/N-acetylglucosamine kinase AmgK [Brevundimonas sp.]|uniref:N-acetylmuramate/N-acetylglucosamine kinase AmgK n=1 Tax=Brevundimonas sp. TaxID=1871086 RepID=UPI003D6C94C2